MWGGGVGQRTTSHPPKPKAGSTLINDTLLYTVSAKLYLFVFHYAGSWFIDANLLLNEYIWSSFW